MRRSLSQLVHTVIKKGNGERSIITLHKYDQRGPDVVDYAVAAAPTGRIVALESSKGVYVDLEVTGYTWYTGNMEAPSPVHFGEVLGEIERFLWDQHDRWVRTNEPYPLPILLGVEQGANMALAVAGAMPDLLSGVIAINGVFPIVPGWDPPLAPVDDLPILVVDFEEEIPSVPGKVLRGTGLTDLLLEWGADVTRGIAQSDEIPGDMLKAWVDEQPSRFLPPGSSLLTR